MSFNYVSVVLSPLFACFVCKWQLWKLSIRALFYSYIRSLQSAASEGRGQMLGWRPPTASQVCVRSSWSQASDCDSFAEYGEYIPLVSENNQRVLYVISA